MKKRKKAARRRKVDVWFNEFMRLKYRELARLQDENQRLREQMGLPSRRT